MRKIETLPVICSLLFAFSLVFTQNTNAQSSNLWSTAGQMLQARTGAAAVSLSNGEILIAGGSDSNGVPQASAEIFDPATGQFSQAAPMNVPRAKQAAITLNTGDVLVTGGLTTGGGYSDTAEIFNAQTGTWTLLDASLGGGLAKHAMATLPDGNILIVGGESTGGPVLTLLLFRLSDQSINPIGSLLAARTDASAAATPDGRVVIAGGTDSNGTVLSSTEIFVYSPDTLSGSIAAGPNMTYPRTRATATTTYDGVAVIGGNNGSIDLGTAEIFSQWTNVFRIVNGATPRSGHIAALLPKNGSILAMGGTGGTAVDLLQPWGNNLAGAFIPGASSTLDHSSGFLAPGSLGIILAAGGIGSSANSAELYWFPTISTDQPDYAPGTPVVMKGAGFKAGETVKLYMREWVNQMLVDPPDYSVTTDASGGFTFSDYAPTTTDVGARYHLTAVGENSGLQAQTIFHDSKPNSVSVGSQNPNPVQPGASTQYNITIAFNGNSNLCTIDLSVGGLPGGASGSFNPSSLSASASGSSVLTISTTSATAANSYSFSVTATGRSNCQSPNNPVTGNGTLVVAAPSPTTVTVSNASGTFGGTVNLSATLTVTSGGAALSGQTLSFSLNGTNVGTGVTDTNGRAILSNVSLSGISAGTYSSGITASFAGASDFSSSAGSASLTVAPVQVTLTAGSYSGTYDGNPHPLSSCSSTVPGMVTCANNPSGPVGPDVSSGTVTPTPAFSQGSANDYAITSNNGSWSITALAVTLTGGSYSGTYDGAPHALSACSSTQPAFATCTNSPAGPVGPEVGSASVVPTPAFTKGSAIDYTITSSNGSWSISPLAITLSAGSYSGVYDGSAHALSACSSTQSGFVTCLNNPAGPVGPDVNTAAVSPTPVFVQGSSGDYAITSNNGSWSITPLAVSVTAGNYSGAYDGNSHDPSACKSTYAGVSCANDPASVGPDVSSGAVAPVPTVVTGITADYTITKISGAYSITPLALSLTAGSYTGTYDGNPHPLSGCSSTQPTFVTCTNNPTGPVGPDVTSGAVNPAPSYVKGSAIDYSITSNNGSYSITPLAVTITAGSYSAIYDGIAHSPSACKSTYPGVSCSNDPASVGPDVASGVVAPVPGIESGINADYVITKENGAWSITPLAVTLTAGGYSAVYDGSAHPLSACSSSQAGFVTCTNDPSGPVGPDVGSDTVKPVPMYGKGSSIDYTITSNNGSWSIAALPVTLTAGGYTGIYDGTAHSPSACLSTYPGISCTNSPASVGPDVSSGDITPVSNLISGVAADYIITPKSGSWSISPLALTLTAGSYSGVYDGSTHPLSACSSTEPGFVTCSNDPAGPVGPDVNSATVTPTPNYLKGSGVDYTITNSNGSWSITPLAVTVTGGSYTGTYDGAAHQPSACTSTYSGVSCANNPNSVGADVGSGTITVSSGIVSGNPADYTITTKDGSWSISPLAVTITAGSYTGIYDGNAHGPSACTTSYPGVSCTNAPNSVGPDVSSGSISPASKIESGISADYTINPVNGSWSISPLAVTVTGGSYSATYDGIAHAPSTCTSTYPGVGCANNPTSVGPDVGSGAIAATSSIISGNPTDYTIATKDGSWSISPLSVAVTAGGYSGVYDGNSHPLPACSSTQPSFVSCANDPAGPVGPDVSSATVVPTVSYLKGTPNDYSLTANNASFSITPLAVTLTAGSYSGTYDAVSHALSTCSSTSPTLVTCTNNPTGPVGPGVGFNSVSPTPVFAAGSLSDYILTDRNGSWSITKAQPAFSGLTNQNIVYGTSSITLSGVIAAPGSVYPPSGATVSIGINGSTVSAAIGPNGVFSVIVDTRAIPVSAGPYSISYNYGGDTNFLSAPTASSTLTVKYAIGGICDGDLGHQILQPINANGTSVFSSKSTSPAKFRVCDANGVSVGTPGVVKSFVLYQIVSGTATTVNEVVDSTTPDSTFRWDPTAQQWIFNISNKNLGPANQTYFFLVTLNDGSTIPFSYGLK